MVLKRGHLVEVSLVSHGAELYPAGNGNATLHRTCPNITVVGTYTPPFRPLNRSEWRALESQLEAAHPDIVWVGLSTPKQEKFMAENFQRLPCKLMIGVGAAFDIHTGHIKDAPQ